MTERNPIPMDSVIIVGLEATGGDLEQVSEFLGSAGGVGLPSLRRSALDCWWFIGSGWFDITRWQEAEYLLLHIPCR